MNAMLQFFIIDIIIYNLFSYSYKNLLNKNAPEIQFPGVLSGWGLGIMFISGAIHDVGRFKSIAQTSIRFKGTRLA